MTVPMTAPVSCPPAASIDSASALPRKRRRRAPASGAADDCFSCSKRNTKCDRKRPYCSQCLLVGNECSGYKTQLTWGVGVASRGKLRGLSLPIAKSAPAVKCMPMVTGRPRTTSNLSRHSKNSRHEHDEETKIKVEPQNQMLGASYTQYDFINMVPSSPTSMNMSPIAQDWASLSPEYMRPAALQEQPNQQQLLRQSLQRLSTPTYRRGGDLNLSPSVGSMSGFSDHDYNSPLEHTFQVEDVPFMNSPGPLYNYSSQNSPVDQAFALSNDNRGPTSCPDQYYPQSDMSSSLTSHQDTYEVEDNRLATSPGEYSRSDMYFDDGSSAMSTSHDNDQFMSQSHRSALSWSSVPDSDYGQPAGGDRGFMFGPPESMQLSVRQEISPRLGFYLSYYEKVICPITVAIDSPSNPYRHQILSLASESESLQHAICALASCNMRNRRKKNTASWSRDTELGFSEPRHNGLYQTLNERSTQEASFDGPEDEAAAQEEYHHRTQAVSLLNAQLNDPSVARQDAVLATLFILCHYRMCESGIAQFKTQFAGVKKIMGMRSSGVETGIWCWMESLFTFFDAITATVNDREAQLRGGYLDMVAAPNNPECALENLAGCDGKLFKTIAALGRLNLLSQGRPVMAPLNNSTMLHQPVTPTMSHQSPSRPRLAGQALVDFYRQNQHKFDGNGFASTIPEEDFLGSYSPNPVTPTTLNPTSANSNHSNSTAASLSGTQSGPASSSTSPFPDDDLRAQFWHEWQSTRHALNSWSFSPATLLACLPSSSTPSATEIRDFHCVSEAFRCAALLYTERLASPSLPSGGSNFQSLVSRAMGWIGGLSEGSKCEKFLLWPLFVIGSEMVEEGLAGGNGGGREEIRMRCRSVAERGGYGNNGAGLDILERVWAENDSGMTIGTGKSPFKWTKFMDGVEGEYIMV